MPQDQLPGCDFSELVKQCPRDFLEPPQDEMIARLAAVHALLRAELEGADIDAMLSEDPQILTQDPASQKVVPCAHDLLHCACSAAVSVSKGTSSLIARGVLSALLPRPHPVGFLYIITN